MIAPVKEPERRSSKRHATPGLARAHHWISKTLLIETPASTKNSKNAARMWTIVAWIAIVAAFYFGRLVADLVDLH